MSDLDFTADTSYIRTWLSCGAVPTDALVAELRAWADFWDETSGAPIRVDVVNSCGNCTSACWWPRCPRYEPDELDGDTIVRGMD